MTNLKKEANKRRLLVHATNIRGRGVWYIVRSLLKALVKTGALDNATIYTSSDELLRGIDWRESHCEVVLYRRLLPNTVSRVFELAATPKKFQAYENTLVLGDMPLRGVRNQAVFTQQAHLIKPAVNHHSSNSVRCKFSRLLFQRNLKSVKKVVVQTEPMKGQFLRSYRQLEGRIVVIPQPAPDWIHNQCDSRKVFRPNELRLFYPAMGYGYLYKNHNIIAKMEEDGDVRKALVREIVVTLEAKERQALFPRMFSWLRSVGRVGADKCLECYHNSDALFFPSYHESYGLPLVEAMTLGLPILCADLPYARWLCGEQAIYFDPASSQSAWQAIGELHARLSNGWQPNWSHQLAGLPKDWDSVAEQFIVAMDL